jgi:hypothetical protein
VNFSSTGALARLIPWAAAGRVGVAAAATDAALLSKKVFLFISLTIIAGWYYIVVV